MSDRTLVVFRHVTVAHLYSSRHIAGGFRGMRDHHDGLIKAVVFKLPETCFEHDLEFSGNRDSRLDYLPARWPPG